MKLTRIALASVAAFFAYFAVSVLIFGLLPSIKCRIVRKLRMAFLKLIRFHFQLLPENYIDRTLPS
jgi:hypothetical protein